MKLCQDKKHHPPLSYVKSKDILSWIKKNVKDFHSITALHYINAGEEGISHLLELLNAIIREVNILEELKIAIEFSDDSIRVRLWDIFFSYYSR